MMIAMLCAVTMIGFASCSDDDEVPEDNTNKAVGYKFELTYKKIDGADNANITDATLHFVDYQGNKVNKTIPLMTNTFTAKSQPYTKLPGELVVTVDETLKSDAKLDKDVYKIGMDLTFTVVSFNAEGAIIDMQSKQQSSTMSVKKENLSKLYPETTSFSYSIDANGKISVK